MRSRKKIFAQLVYNDSGVGTHFDLRIWVCASIDFDSQRLANVILEVATGEEYIFEDIDLYQYKLQEKLEESFY